MLGGYGGGCGGGQGGDGDRDGRGSDMIAYIEEDINTTGESFPYDFKRFWRFFPKC